jgi:hypothetical protein
VNSYLAIANAARVWLGNFCVGERKPIQAVGLSLKGFLRTFDAKLTVRSPAVNRNDVRWLVFPQGDAKRTLERSVGDE